MLKKVIPYAMLVTRGAFLEAKQSHRNHGDLREEQIFLVQQCSDVELF